ncbi:MAG: hypothetical protein HDT09_03820 [Bacteroidales bacterium]|nr:hypothetical protein [Bacteroidales bacterium]
MRSIFLSLFIAVVFGMTSNAQTFLETFDTNTFGWTESGPDGYYGSSVIDNGVMTLKSKGDTKFLRFAANAHGFDRNSETTAFETHCYAPIDVAKPFEIVAKIQMDNLDLEREAGIIFNYRDFGNYYAFVFDKQTVTFLRMADNYCIGSISQDVKWDKAIKGKQNQVWKLVSDNGDLRFFVNDVEILMVKYMPLDFAGVGFCTIGKQTLIVDEVIFTQK